MWSISKCKNPVLRKHECHSIVSTIVVYTGMIIFNIPLNTLAIFFENYIRIKLLDYLEKNGRSGEFSIVVTLSSSFINSKEMTLCIIVDLDFVRSYTSSKSDVLSNWWEISVLHKNQSLFLARWPTGNDWFFVRGSLQD